MTYRELTHKKLMEIFEKRGTRAALTAAEGLLHSKEYSKDLAFKRELNGELCETVLEILLKSYYCRNLSAAKEWHFVKSFVLSERGKSPYDFLTEIDLALFTPACIFLFECKSYSGEKTLIDDGKLYRNGKFACDVFSQSLLHKRTLEPWVNDFVVSGRTPLIQMCMFEYSNGPLTDKRGRAARIEMPCLNAAQVIDYVKGFTETVWNMAVLKKALGVLEVSSDNFRSAHLNYVKELHKR